MKIDTSIGYNVNSNLTGQPISLMAIDIGSPDIADQTFLKSGDDKVKISLGDYKAIQTIVAPLLPPNPDQVDILRLSEVLRFGLLMGCTKDNARRYLLPLQLKHHVLTTGYDLSFITGAEERDDFAQTVADDLCKPDAARPLFDSSGNFLRDVVQKQIDECRKELYPEETDGDVPND